MFAADEAEGVTVGLVEGRRGFGRPADMEGLFGVVVVDMVNSLAGYRVGDVAPLLSHACTCATQPQ